MGYALDEVRGQHHRMFVRAGVRGDRRSTETFWERLGRGDFESGEYTRLAQGRPRGVAAGHLQPDPRRLTAAPLKVVKFASDITEAKLRNAEIEARINAVDRAQAVIEFDLEGIVLGGERELPAHDGLLAARDRRPAPQHASARAEYARSPEYRDFWLRLRKGEVLAGRFQRVGKYGREVHIQATYNPVLDPAGRAVKVVKYAYDITEQVQRERGRRRAAPRGMTTAVQQPRASRSSRSRATPSDATALAPRTQRRRRRRAPTRCAPRSRPSP